MLDTNLELIEELKQFCSIITSDNDIFNHFRSSDKDFTRNRKLPLEKLAFLIARLCKKTLSREIESYFKDIGIEEECSVSAFIQQRKKLAPAFFNVWNQYLCRTWYELNADRIKRFGKYRVVAVDGSNVTLINKEQLTAHFSGQGNGVSTYTIGKTFYYYDVLNELVLFSKIGSYRTGELTMAYSMTDRIGEDMLTIYDRNFFNYRMMALHMLQEVERKFVIRANETTRIVKAFIASGKTSSMVQMKPSKKMMEGMYQSGYKITERDVLNVRFVRVELKNSIEVIATNLWEEEYETSIFKDLYFMRWGVETNISSQKNIMQLESFSGLNVRAIEQDFYATIFMTNLQSVLLKPAQEQVDKEPKRRKYPMKINRNKSFAELKMKFIQLFFVDNPLQILEKLYKYFRKELLPIRKGRTYKREIKNNQTKSKFKTFSNFKPAY